MGSVGEVLPSRDSTRIAKHTFDAAKIGIISESCKYFAFYFHFLPPRTFNPRDSLYALYDSHNPLFPYFVANTKPVATTPINIWHFSWNQPKISLSLQCQSEQTTSERQETASLTI